MANPLAAHTFDFWRIYLSERNDAAPGAGTWGTNQLIYDGNLVTPQYLRASVFSAGALSATDTRGIVVKSDVSSGSSKLLFLGEGLPDAPIPVSVTVGAFESFDAIDFWDTSQGAWSYGSDLYIAGYLNQSPSAFWLIKSTNGGASWTRLTHANAPPGDGELAAIQRINDTLYFFAPSDTLGTGNFALYALDLSTGVWAAPTAALTSSGIAEFCIAAHGKWSNGLIVYPDGDIGIFYVSSALGYLPAYREWNGASWGAAVTLPGEACANMIIDPGQEIIHCFTYDGIFDEDDVIYSKVAHGGGLTSTIFTIPGVPSSDGVGHSSIQNDKIFVPRDDNVVNSVWVALLSDGQFVEEVLPTPSDETNKIQSLSISNAGSGYTASTYVRIDGYAGTNPTYGFISAVNGSGGVTSFSFGASAAVPIGGGYSVGIVGTTPGWTTPAVGTGLTVNITAVAAKEPSCAYMMFPNGFTPEPFGLACPIDNTIALGVPYSGTLTVSGGTAPFTFVLLN